MQRQYKGYFRDERASVTIFAVVTFAFLMAFSGLIFDVGRIFNLHSQAQAYADEVALAAAAELDGEAGSITRAVRAAIGDGQRDSIIDSGFRLTLSGDNAVDVESLTFLSAIAADPDPDTRQPVAGDTVLCTVEGGVSDCVADHDAQAAFVLVTTSVETENFLLFPIAAAFMPGMIDQASVQPQALAGFNRQICNFPPMAICNPSESPGGGGEFTIDSGVQILLQTTGGGSTWAPGNFGFLDLTGLGNNNCTGGGANFLRCLLATNVPNTECTSATVDFEPGNIDSANVGFNIRFDIFDPPFQNEKDNLNFPPAINVTKGVIPDNCRVSGGDNDINEQPLEAFPIDPGLSASNRIGSGMAAGDLAAYWAANHGGAAPPVGVTTRYQAYLEEINIPDIPDNTGDVSPPIVGENGNPTCSTVPPAPNRRKIVVAVVNCIEHSVTGSARDVPVIEFIEMFLTHHIDPSADDIYAEVIDVIQPGGLTGVLHEFPVLYR